MHITVDNGKYEFVYVRRLCEFINMMQGEIRRDREHEQSRDIEQFDYVDLAVANNKYMVGTEVWIIKDDVWQEDNPDVLGGSGTVIS